MGQTLGMFTLKAQLHLAINSSTTSNNEWWLLCWDDSKPWCDAVAANRKFLALYLPGKAFCDSVYFNSCQSSILDKYQYLITIKTLIFIRVIQIWGGLLGWISWCKFLSYSQLLKWSIVRLFWVQLYFVVIDVNVFLINVFDRFSP